MSRLLRKLGKPLRRLGRPATTECIPECCEPQPPAYQRASLCPCSGPGNDIVIPLSELPTSLPAYFEYAGKCYFILFANPQNDPLGLQIGHVEELHPSCEACCNSNPQPCWHLLALCSCITPGTCPTGNRYVLCSEIVAIGGVIGSTIRTGNCCYTVGSTTNVLPPGAVVVTGVSLAQDCPTCCIIVIPGNCTSAQCSQCSQQINLVVPERTTAPCNIPGGTAAYIRYPQMNFVLERVPGTCKWTTGGTPTPSPVPYNSYIYDCYPNQPCSNGCLLDTEGWASVECGPQGSTNLQWILNVYPGQCNWYKGGGSCPSGSYSCVTPPPCDHVCQVIPVIFGSSPTDRGSRGLGDTVAKIASRLGFKQTRGCGCSKRQAALNRWWPYRK